MKGNKSIRKVRLPGLPKTTVRAHADSGSDMGESHYDVLGVDGRTASTEEIKRAYKSLVRSRLSVFFFFFSNDDVWRLGTSHAYNIAPSQPPSLPPFAPRRSRFTRTSKVVLWMDSCACRGRGRRGSLQTSSSSVSPTPPQPPVLRSTSFSRSKNKREKTTIPFICGHAFHRLSDHHTRADNAADAVSHELVQYYFLSVR